MRLALIGMMAGALACTAMAQDSARDQKAAAGLARELAGLTPGKPQSCIQSFDRDSVKSFGDTIVYRSRGSARFVSKTTGCQDVGDDNILITKSFGTDQLCRGDIATTVDRTSHFQTGGCAFGDFTPYTRAK